MSAIERLRDIQQDLWRLARASAVAEQRLIKAYGDAWPSRVSQDIYAGKIADARRHNRDSSSIRQTVPNLDDGRDLIDALRYLSALEPLRRVLTDAEVRRLDLIANFAHHTKAERYKAGDEERVRRWVDRILTNVESAAEPPAPAGPAESARRVHSHKGLEVNELHPASGARRPPRRWKIGHPGWTISSVFLRSRCWGQPVCSALATRASRRCQQLLVSSA